MLHSAPYEFGVSIYLTPVVVERLPSSWKSSLGAKAVEIEKAVAKFNSGQSPSGSPMSLQLPQRRRSRGFFLVVFAASLFVVLGRQRCLLQYQ